MRSIDADVVRRIKRLKDKLCGASKQEQKEINKQIAKLRQRR